MVAEHNGCQKLHQLSHVTSGTRAPAYRLSLLQSPEFSQNTRVNTTCIVLIPVCSCSHTRVHTHTVTVAWMDQSRAVVRGGEN